MAGFAEEKGAPSKGGTFQIRMKDGENFAHLNELFDQAAKEGDATKEEVLTALIPTIELALAVNAPDSIHGDVKAARAALDAANSRITAIAKSYAVVRGECEENYRSKLNEPAAQIAELRNAASEEKEKAGEQIAARDAEIKRFEAELSEKSSEIEGLTGRIAGFDTEREKWLGKIIKLNDRIAELLMRSLSAPAAGQV